MLRFALAAAAVATVFSAENLAQRVGLLPFSLDPVALDDQVTAYEQADWAQPIMGPTWAVDTRG